MVATALQPLKAGFGGYDAYEDCGYRRCGDGEVDSVAAMVITTVLISLDIARSGVDIARSGVDIARLVDVVHQKSFASCGN